MNILLVLAGKAPSSSLLKDSIQDAELVIAVDGGANVFEKYDLKPDLILGDLDSVTSTAKNEVKIINADNQDKSDLQKAFDYTMENHKPSKILILGATGGRTDHLVNNLSICTQVDPEVEITLKSDCFDCTDYQSEIITRVTPHSRFIAHAPKGTTMSIIHVSAYEGLSSHGLKWEIVNSDSNSHFISQSNVAYLDNPAFTVGSGCVYVAVYQ